MIASRDVLDEDVLTSLRLHDPVVQRCRTLFALLDWSVLPGPTSRPRSGPPHPLSASIKALLIKLCEHKEYLTHLRSFLVDHPLLVLEMGFRPVRDPTQPCASRTGVSVPASIVVRVVQLTAL